MKKHLSIDIETYSSIDLAKAGAYKYAEAEDFEILLFAYKLGEEETTVVDLSAGEILPENIKRMLNNPKVIKHAYNATFEWICLNAAGYETPIEQWECTMVHGMYLGYPAGLGAIGQTIGLPEDKQKLTTGRALITYFCKPCKPTKKNGGRTRNLPKHDPEKWSLFKDYNRQDVEAEHAILTRLSFFPMPQIEQQRWQKDTLMNARGVAVDSTMISWALCIDDEITRELMEKAGALTGLNNPNSRAQLLSWVQDYIDTDNLRKETVEELLGQEETPENVREVLRIRQQLGKTSVSKYKAMDEAKGADNRVRGLLQFYGANRTGRWAGRLVQVQNLPRNYLKTLDEARNMVKGGYTKAMQIIYGNVPDTLSQLIRTAFVPSAGNKFIVADFSAIEARIIAWLAGETWATAEFAGEGLIYEATAAQMFGVDKALIKKGNPEYELRQKGKVATLALGYQGSTSALVAMGALNMGIKEEELQDIVDRWRNANPNICALWYEVGNAALATMQTAEPQMVAGGRVTIRLEGEIIHGQSFMTIELPSGRKLYYAKPWLQENRFGREAIHYMDINQTTRKWEENSTYGGKLVENITQAIARDCLAETLDRLDDWYDTVMHIHDEVVIDAPEEAKVSAVCGIMGEPINWAPGLILTADGFETPYYKKD
jgi:DNA polymerase